jgi:hypothetical protein
MIYTYSYTKEFSFPVAIVYGKVKKNYRSFLDLVIKELELVSAKPLLVKRNGEKVACAKVHLLCIIGDGIEQQALMNHKGHQSIYGCR